MTFCINPFCSHRENLDTEETCQSCHTPLVIEGRYRIIRILKEASTSRGTTVYEVFDFQENIKKILKVLNTKTLKLEQLFIREHQILSRIRHPSIPRCFLKDYFELRIVGHFSLQCFVMEYIEGLPLDQWVNQNGRATPAQALKWLHQLAEILQYIHNHKYFHRDIKPSNIILRPNGDLALVDFGAARTFGSETYLARIASDPRPESVPDDSDITVLMSAGYSPREQCNGKAVPQSDFYALGRTIIHLITGVHPNHLPEDYDTGRLNWRNQVKHLSQPFGNLLERLIEPNPLNRPINAKVLLKLISSLPKQIARAHLIHSKPFIIGISAISLFLGFGLLRSFSVVNGLLLRYYTGLAAAKFDLTNLDSVKQWYSAALYEDPKNSTVYINLANACRDKGDMDCALQNYRQALRLDPKRPSLYANLGGYYDDLEQYDEAILNYQQAIRLGGDRSIESINNLSRLMNLSNQPRTAVDLATRGLKALQSQKWEDTKQIEASLYKNLGWGLLKVGKTNEAVRHLQESVRLLSEKPDAYCLLAQIQSQDLSKHPSNEWKQCFDLNSSLPEVKQWRNGRVDFWLERGRR